MKTSHTLVFDDFIVAAVSSAPVYTDPKWNSQLALPDRLKLTAVIDQVSGTTSFNAQIQESGDNRNFTNNASSAEVTGTIGTGMTNVLIGQNGTGTASVANNPMLSGYVRVSMWFSSGITAHVKLYVTGRGEVAGSGS